MEEAATTPVRAAAVIAAAAAAAAVIAAIIPVKVAPAIAATLVLAVPTAAVTHPHMLNFFCACVVFHKISMCTVVTNAFVSNAEKFENNSQLLESKFHIPIRPELLTTIK